MERILTGTGEQSSRDKDEKGTKTTSLTILTEDNFGDEILRSDKRALVYFFATWCGPCKKVSPIITELAKEYDEKEVKIGMMDVDNNTGLAASYGIRGVPTLLMYKGGTMVDQMVGAHDKATIKQMIDNSEGDKDE